MKSYSKMQHALRKIIGLMEIESQKFLIRLVILNLISALILGFIFNNEIFLYICACIFMIGLMWNSWLRNYLYERLNIIGTSLEYLEKQLVLIDYINHIIKKSDLAYTAFSEIQARKKFIKLFYSKTIGELYDSYYNLVSIFIIKVLTDLRSDLSIRLTEQQSTLESAKSEIEKNITGTTELNQVSELQRARLDKQIEQFEELQRILVKV